MSTPGHRHGIATATPAGVEHTITVLKRIFLLFVEALGGEQLNLNNLAYRPSMQLKSQIRLIYKSKRAQLGPEEREWRSEKIAEKTMGFLSGKPEVQHIHVFLPIKKMHEVDTLPLVEKLQRKGLEVYTSVSDFETKMMNVVRIIDHQGFVEGEHGIPIPTAAEGANREILQLVFIPLLAYDLEGHRLGYGKGFYDRFLASLRLDVLKVGLSFFPPEAEIPVEEHDFPMDACVSPDQIIKF